MIVPDRENDVLLGFCDNGTVQTCFFKSVLNAFSEDAARGGEGQKRRLTEYYYATGPYIHDNRSRVVRYFLECTDKQWLWFCDNDMDFHPGTLYSLLDAAEEHKTPILGAAYWNTYPGYAAYLSWLVVIPDKGFVAVEDLPPVDKRDAPLEVNAVGMGCTLIHRDALQAVSDEYPNDPWDTFAADILLTFNDGKLLIVRSPDDVTPEMRGDRYLVDDPVRLGEDVTFCMRALRVGYKTHGLPSLVVEHFKPHRVEHFRPAQEDATRQGQSAEASPFAKVS